MKNENVVEEIGNFLEGHDPQQYITGIEGDYSENEVHLMIEDPEKGKYLERHKFTPFVFVKDFKKVGKRLYRNLSERDSAMKYHGIEIKRLRTDDKDRLEDGFKYLITTTKKTENLIRFFRGAGFDLFKDPDRLFLYYSGIEQFFIGSGKRMFKGFKSYKDIHKFYFDIETTGLSPVDSSIFLIGMKDNRGFRKVLQIDRNDPIASERQMIIDFFNTVTYLKPAIVAGYNSEFFDFTFILERAKILGINLGSKDEDGNLDYDVQTSLNPNHPLKRKRSTIKFGGETELYEQTIMWGINVIDISHGVRKAMAINSDIKGWGLKYICKYADIAAPNRMYVEDGNKIYKIWEENKYYFVNKENNAYKVIPEGQQNNALKYKEKLVEWVNEPETEATHPSVIKVKDFFNRNSENVTIMRGSDIIFQYLLDDLTETEMVDNKFNESSFMLGSLAPTTYVRAATMGNASLWKMLMVTWSYEQKLAIPINDRKRDFVGGLSRLLRSGYAKNVLKMDFKSLYPSIQLTYDIFPEFDITGILKRMLTYFRDARIEFQQLCKKYEQEGNMELSSFYDIKQLPIKILTNSNFGALSAPDIFPWGDVNLGEQITCTGRQYLRSMVHHFMKYDFQPLVLDTDGCNFSIPDNVNEIFYTDKKGKKHQGYLAVLAEYNDSMIGVMKLEEDGVYKSTINFKRKNYANLIYDSKKGKDKTKLVGASIKSKTIQTYIEKFLDKGIKLLLDGNGKQFISDYYEYVARIYNREIPLIEIANKARVKNKVATYQLEQKTKTQKNGRAMAKQAHMELLIENNLNPSLGDVIYYVNNGKVKSHGDLNNSYLLDMKEIESKPETLGEYNVARYVANFNSRLESLLVCFGDEVRENLLVKNPKDRAHFTDSQMELISGKPLVEEGKPAAQDCIFFEEYVPGYHENEPLMEMSQNEIIFWNKVRKDPREIFPYFTTELAEIKLLDLNDENYELEYHALVADFAAQGVFVKNALDYLVHGDAVIFKDKEQWQLMAFEFGELVVKEPIDHEHLNSLLN